MAPLRRYSTYRGRRARLDEALLERFAMSSAGYWYLRHLAPRIDRVLIPLTRGWLSSMGMGKVGLLTTTGAKSGQQRTQPVALIPTEDGMIAIASNYGRPQHPSWSANLVAHPDCEIVFKGSSRACAAELLTDADRDAAWVIGADFYRGYERYREMCAPRQIRLFRIRPN